MELAATCRAQKGQRGGALMLLTASAIMGTKNTAAGFVAGLHICCLLLEALSRRCATQQAAQLLERQP